MQNLLFHAKPKTYAIIYLGIIPLFAMIFYSFPDVLGSKKTLIECIYFSVVTITTLGYGDILPANDAGRVLAATESILGISLIGLFLNSLSRVRSEEYATKEKIKEQKKYKSTQSIKLINHYNIIMPLLRSHEISIIQITTPIEKNFSTYNENFTFSDLKDIFYCPTLLNRDWNSSRVQLYIDSLNNLSLEIKDLVKMVDLEIFPELKEHCLLFLSIHHRYDYSGALIGATKSETMNKSIRKMIEEHEGEIEFKESNMINPYVALYFQIKEHMEVIKSLSADFKKIKS